MKKRFWIAATTALVGAVVIVWILPRAVESRFNRIVPRMEPTVSHAAGDLHQKLAIVDLHADSLLWGRNLLHRSDLGHVDVPRLQQANVSVQVFGVVTQVPRGLNLNQNGADTDRITYLALAEAWPPYTWTNLLNRALYQASRLQQMADKSQGQLVLIKTSSDLTDVLARHRQDRRVVGGILMLEGAQPLRGDASKLDTLYDAGFRIISLTHFFDDELAGSSTGIARYGLTDHGREVVRAMEAKHILVDLAHASSATIADVTAIATRPVIVSHTGVKTVCNNGRNLSDAEIHAVAMTGGVIAIGYWDTAICGSDARAIVKAIRHVVDVAGIGSAALGSDFDGSTTMPFDTTGLPEITEALAEEGFSETEINLIMGGNALRVLQQSLP
ncbi:MAG TPA: dipeptidase [Candidatus Acidoferrum sp.]|jgi:membrane dipeptidase|nr:dipeptidase [Candidatus Acidoferrum sp.]